MRKRFTGPRAPLFVDTVSRGELEIKAALSEAAVVEAEAFRAGGAGGPVMGMLDIGNEYPHQAEYPDNWIWGYRWAVNK